MQVFAKVAGLFLIIHHIFDILLFQIYRLSN